MEKKNDFGIIGWLCLVFALWIDFKVSISVILAILIMFVTISSFTDKIKDDEIEEVMETMNTSLEEIKNFASILFAVFSAFLMWVAVFHKYIALI